MSGTIGGNGVGGGAANKIMAMRAMFENQNKAESSTVTDVPDRGRSPGVGSAGSGSRNGTSPRPLSKVRTSFIAVGGTSGLLQSSSTQRDSTVRRSAFSMDENSNPQEMAERSDSIATELEARDNNIIISESIPKAALETPAQTPAVKVEKKLEVKTNGTLASAKPATSTKSLNGNTSPKTKAATGGRTLKPAAILTGRSKSPNGTGEKSPRPAATAHAKPATPSTKPATKSTASAGKSLPAAVSTNKNTAAPKKSPVNPKAPSTPKAAIAKQTAPKRAASPAASKTPEKKSSMTSLSEVSRKSPSGTLKAKDGSPSAFVKPRPKSPTKPVRLPASLMAPTASSRSKTSNTTAPPVARSQSRAAAASTSTASGLRRTQSTTVRKSAIGPPPAKKVVSRPSGGGAADGRPISAHGPAPSEGFMARMMRPTASSQSKSNERSPTTPPKKAQLAKRTVKQSTSRPSTSDSTSGQKAFGGSPRGSKTRALSSRPLRSSEKLKEIIAASGPVGEDLKDEEFVPVSEAAPEKVAEIVPETLAEAATIPEAPVALFGEKKECAPIVEKVDEAPTSIEAHGLKEEAAFRISEAVPETTPIEKEESPATSVAEAKVPSVEEKKKEEALKSVDMGETF